MTSPKKLLAIDLGAESGRGILGFFDGEKLRLEIVHRFPNGGVRTLDRLHWDVLRLQGDIVTSLRKAGAEHGQLDSVGVDTWGVDFALIGRDGALLGNPRHYRDPHTEGVLDIAFEKMPKAQLYRHTGLQFLRINSLIQLLALARDRSPLLEMAESLLFMPDLFHYWLTGNQVNEYTDASTSQLLDPATRTWSNEVMQAFGLPRRLAGKLVQPGTMLGPLLPSVAQAAGIASVPVVVPATHDTAAAVAAVPAVGKSWAYISSGTWSLVGVELPQPCTTDEALAANFTNEGGVEGTTRFLKNVMGLWLVQECRRAWERAGSHFGYDELTVLAAAARPFVSIIDPDASSFLLPDNMPTAIADWCRQHGQPVPVDPGASVRCCLESLALKYRWVLERAEALTGVSVQTIHVVGGGCHNALLCQFTADACGRTVVAGPVEATAAGNILTQALGLGLIGSLGDARAVVRRSFDVATYEPRQSEAWQEPYARLRSLVQ